MTLPAPVDLETSGLPVAPCGKLGQLIGQFCGKLLHQYGERPAIEIRRGDHLAFGERDLAYPPFAGALLPGDDTLVCRCEEVTAGDIRRYASIGCLGPNQTKAFGRVGMGPCQGRYCGLTVTELLAAANGRSQDETGYYRIRSPLKPVTLGELAALAASQSKETVE